MNTRINVKFTEEDFLKIERISKAENRSMSDLVRDFTLIGLNGQINQNNMDLIAPIIRDVLKSIIEPSTNRICSLLSKTYIQSGTAAYLTAETINRFVDDSLRMDVVEAFEAAKKRAIIDMKSNINLKE